MNLCIILSTKLLNKGIFVPTDISAVKSVLVPRGSIVKTPFVPKKVLYSMREFGSIFVICNFNLCGFP